MNNKTLEELIDEAKELFVVTDWKSIKVYDEIKFEKVKDILKKVYEAGQKNGFKLGMDTGKNYIEITKSK